MRPFIKLFGVAFFIAVLIILATTVQRMSQPPAPTSNKVTVASSAPLITDVSAKRQTEMDSLAREAKTNALSAKALKICQRHADWETWECLDVARKVVVIGMRGDQVRASWGSPESVNRTVVPSIVTGRDRVSEQWVYASDYVYLTDGRVDAIQTSRGR
jgi:hypothetical protein